MLFDNGRILGPSIGESLNHHSVTELEASNRLNQHLAALAPLVGIQTVEELSQRSRCLVLCLPGGATEGDRACGHRLLSMAGWDSLAKSIVVDDTWAGAVAGADDGKAICCIAGTGASVFVSDGQFSLGRTSKLDGWGPLLGDYGSRFRLAINSLEYICRELDRGRKPMLLGQLFEMVPSLRRMGDIQQWFDSVLNRGHTAWRLELSEIASIVISATELSPSQYPDALALVNKAAAEFSETICIAVRRHSPFARTLPILGYGEMVDTSSLFRQRVAFDLQAQLGQQFEVKRRTIPFGCLLMVANPFSSLVPRAEERAQILTAVESATPEVKSVLFR